MFYNVKDYPKLQIVEDSWEIIKKEYIENDTDSLLIERREAALHETLDENNNYVPNAHEGHTMNPCDYYDGKWLMFGFRYRGEDLLENQAMFPQTMRILNSIDYYVHTMGFSVLGASSHINKHYDPDEIEPPQKTMRGHLGLINCNDKCSLTLFDHAGGEETYRWKAGELMIFDIQQEHKADNFSSEKRVVMLFDFKLEPAPHNCHFCSSVH
tara:strand:- start:1346 stop:1981 length:636 start_codon:yes stop_codon:yes gene_type:complete